MLLLVIVAVGSYYAARILLEGWPKRRRPSAEDSARPYGPDDDDEFLATLSKRPERGDDPS